MSDNRSGKNNPRRKGSHFAPAHKGPGDTRKQPCPNCGGKWTWQVLNDYSTFGGAFGHELYWRCKTCDKTYKAA